MGEDLLVKVDATVGEFAKGSLLFQLCVKRHCQLVCLEFPRPHIMVEWLSASSASLCLPSS